MLKKQDIITGLNKCVKQFGIAKEQNETSDIRIDFHNGYTYLSGMVFERLDSLYEYWGIPKENINLNKYDADGNETYFMEVGAYCILTAQDENGKSYWENK